MGVVANIGVNKFPKQDEIGRVVSVMFNYDSSKELSGIIVRQDTESPFRMIIQLEDGRLILSTECQYSYKRA